MTPNSGWVLLRMTWLNVKFSEHLQLGICHQDLPKAFLRLIILAMMVLIQVIIFKHHTLFLPPILSEFHSQFQIAFHKILHLDSIDHTYYCFYLLLRFMVLNILISLCLFIFLLCGRQISSETHLYKRIASEKSDSFVTVLRPSFSFISQITIFYAVMYL